MHEPGEVADLVERLTYSQDGVTVREERDLWNAPILYLALLGLLVGEWTLRRTGGLS